MEGGESTSSSGDQCQEDCPFCKDKRFLGYKTKDGAKKNEKVLAVNLRSEKDVVSDPAVGNVYPTPGGCDPTTGWEAKAGVLEDFPVALKATPHHLIPGNASMEPSTLETWTLASKGRIKEDIGYNIDGALNGIFLPHLPEIYWTRHYPGTKTPMSRYFGQTWTGLSPSAKATVGAIVMCELWLQMHYTDHDDPYVHVDNTTSYDDECEQECNALADIMSQRAKTATCKDDDGKLAPPYELVARINNKSTRIKGRIVGNPRRWTSWVSPIAQDLTQHFVQNSTARLVSQGLFRRLP